MLSIPGVARDQVWYEQPPFYNQPNLKYMVCPIRKSGFQDLAFLVPKDGPVGLIPKTMVFVNKIEDAIRLERYLRSRLPDRVRNGKQAFVIIQLITSNLDANTKTRVMEDLRYGNTRICVCTECAGMGINIPDIMRAVQFKIPDFIALPELLQRLGRGGRDKSCAAIAMVFVHPSQVLPDDVHMLEQSAFKNLRLPVSRENREQITDVIAQLYKNKLQSAKKTGNAYERTDPGILWFLNTSGCRRQLILACFMCKKAFKPFPDLADCCDNCMYNHTDAGQVPDFELHDVTARLAMMYKRTLEYSKLQISAERNRLRATNPRNPRTIAKQALACEKALDSFARQRWPDHSLADIKFLSDWRKRLAKVAIRITTVEQLHKELLLACHLRFSSLEACAQELVDIITSTALANSPNPPSP
ncbi:C-terminal helicase domain-containing protein [uncultured Nostoc sp.]|uniref:C-terminal helicase domain-containing protein n=1 Tax=uncultured Nostoc sp. TaxID=340711 RepID=UPI0035C9FB79